MDEWENLKNRYIEVSLRIDAMVKEARASAMEWRRTIRAANEMRRDILNRMRNYDEMDRLSPMLPGFDDGEVDEDGSGEA